MWGISLAELYPYHKTESFRLSLTRHWYLLKLQVSMGVGKGGTFKTVIYYLRCR